jgi:hypothetical protein
MTTTSESMTDASANDASGPRARVCARMASVADGLRDVAMIPHRSATAMTAVSVMPAVNGSSGRAATNTPPVIAMMATVCTTLDTASDLMPLRSWSIRSSVPPASAISASASVLTGASAFTELVSMRWSTCGPARMPASRYPVR